jgi:hypothetical protein
MEFGTNEEQRRLLCRITGLYKPSFPAAADKYEVSLMHGLN